MADGTNLDTSLLHQTLQAIVTVLAIINPVVCGSIFLTLTPNLELRRKRQAAVHVALSILTILVASAFIGLQVLGVFGISLDVFRIVGGIIIAYMGFDTDAESDASVFRVASCKLINTSLELHSSSNRLDRARKLCQEPVAGILHDAAAVFGYCRVDSFLQERRQPSVCGFFVAMHEPRIASHVGGQYR